MQAQRLADCRHGWCPGISRVANRYGAGNFDSSESDDETRPRANRLDVRVTSGSFDAGVREVRELQARQQLHATVQMHEDAGGSEPEIVESGAARRRCDSGIRDPEAALQERRYARTSVHADTNAKRQP